MSVPTSTPARDDAPKRRPAGAAGEPAQVAFRAMGCRAHVVIHGGQPSMLVSAERRIRELESRWSRFLDTSDITVANRAAGRPVRVHPDTLAVVERAIAGWRQTGGAFDATVLPHLLAHGYTHSTTTKAPAPALGATRVGVSGSIVVDFAASTLTVPAGAAVDLGGIGKGFAADIIAEDLVADGARGALVNIGGDLAVYGEPAPGESWYLGIDDPAAPGRHLTCLRVGAGGVATSGTTIRRWTNSSGQAAHHLIDPRTAEPSRAGLATVTVLAGDAATAEVFATAAMMLAGPAAMAMLEAHGLAGLAVGDDGQVHRSSTFAVFEA
jgi:thiamine biosynthesis lipoprotein